MLINHLPIKMFTFCPNFHILSLLFCVCTCKIYFLQYLSVTSINHASLLQYFGESFLGPGIFSYVTTVQLSISGSLTLTQLFYLIYSPYCAIANCCDNTLLADFSS